MHSIFSKDIEQKPFCTYGRVKEVENGPTFIIIGGFYPKSNDLSFMINNLCIKYESNTLILSKAIEWKTFILHTDGT